jgi:hypothetical protein
MRHRSNIYGPPTLSGSFPPISCIRQVAHERRLGDQAGELGAGASRERHEFVRCCFEDHALDRCHLRRPLQGLGYE